MADNPETRLTLCVDGRLGRYPVKLEGGIGGGEARFNGQIDIDQTLGDFLATILRALKVLGPNDPGPIPQDTFPEIDIAKAQIDYDTVDSAFGISVELPVKLPPEAPLPEIKLAFAFATAAATKADGPRRYAAGLRSLTPIGLSGMTGGSSLIAKILGEVAISEIGIFYATDAIDGLAAVAPDFGQRQIAGGVSFSAAFGTAENSVRLELAQPAEPVAEAEGYTGAALKAPADSAPIRKWVKVDKSFGPINLRRIGGEWHDGRLGILLDAGVDLPGLKVGLAGLSVSVEPGRLTKLQPKDIFLGLDGLDLSYNGGPVQFTGAFLRTQEQNKPDRYDGLALVRTPVISVTALGSYTTVNGNASLFIFAALHANLGGPPFFQVQGLSGGFGYNRRLTLPPIEEVHEFPLVRAALDPSFIDMDKPGEAVPSALEKLGTYVSPCDGEYWIAAGIKFSSFEIVQSVALLSVSFGEDVEIGLLGLSRLELPKKGTGIEFAQVELALRAAIRPATGEIFIEGRLTDASWIFTRSCRLTGGFAFYLWVAGEHAGDFVVTLGGYGPDYIRPPHYPSVPRIGVSWDVGMGLTFTSELYFALTPSCIMAGGKLVATYNTSWLRAWFVAYAQFTAQWQPLTYHADMGIRIGIELDLEIFSIHIEVGVRLEIWGPPFQYRAQVDLWAISFTIGKDRPGETQKTVEPPEFIKAFLSDEKAVISTRITAGLIEQHETRAQQPLRIVSAQALRLEITSQVPLTGFHTTLPGVSADTIASAGVHGIMPLGSKTLNAPLTVRMWRDNQEVKDEPAAGLSVGATALRGRAPNALWGHPENTEGDALIKVSRGATLCFNAPEPAGALPPMLTDTLSRQPINRPEIPARRDAPVPPDETPVMGDVDGSEVSVFRSLVLQALREREFDLPGQVHLSRMRAALDKNEGHSEDYFQASPKICALGALREREIA